MRKHVFGIVVLSVLCARWVSAATPAPQTDPPYGRSGSQAVASVEFNWHDDSRNRDVPVKIYYPITNTAPCPIIIFSHGLGGSRDGYEYLGRHWASRGYVSVHPTHIGSDTSILRTGHPYQAMQQAVTDLKNAIDRPKDVSFVIDQLATMNRSNETFKGRLALDRIGIAGHSFGGYTVLASSGQTFALTGGRDQTLGDPRIKVAIAMSAPAKRVDDATLDRMYGSITIPCFHMTGTKDNSPIGDTKAADRRIPFDHMRGADNYLLILTGGDHMVFSGRLLPVSREKDERFHELILAGSTAFWDAYLRNDAAAKAWLSGGSFKSAVGTDGTFETKPANAVSR